MTPYLDLEAAYETLAATPEIFQSIFSQLLDAVETHQPMVVLEAPENHVDTTRSQPCDKGEQKDNEL